jgi:hypothetical protein
MREHFAVAAACKVRHAHARIPRRSRFATGLAAGFGEMRRKRRPCPRGALEVARDRTGAAGTAPPRQDVSASLDRQALVRLSLRRGVARAADGLHRHVPRDDLKERFHRQQAINEMHQRRKSYSPNQCL